MNGVHRQHLEERIMKTADQERRAEYLERLYDVAHTLVRKGHAAEWRDRTGQLIQDAVSLP